MNIGRVLFDPELLLRLVRGRYEVVENALPASTQLRGVSYDYERGAVSLMVEHPSFPTIAAGGILPILPSPIVRPLPGERLTDLGYRISRAAQDITSRVETHISDELLADDIQRQFEQDGWPVDTDNDCAP